MLHMIITTCWLHDVAPEKEVSFTKVLDGRRAANPFAGGYGYALVLKSVSRVTSACGFRLRPHGTRRAYEFRTIRRRVNAASRRCNCPMEIRDVQHGDAGSVSLRWRIKHRDKAMVRNHASLTHPAAQPVHRRAARTETV